MNPNTVEYTVQLAVLASLIDGQASDQEKGIIVELVSHHLRCSQEEVGQMLERWLNIYQQQGVGNNPGAALHFACQALQPLQFRDKHIAFFICDCVVRSDRGISPEENYFIQDLSRLVFS
ncbi:MAG: tellurite resistance TerB family protein [Cyanobacteriota bacterium]|nr:tellurite resistance TerB family protein [Cyanobacteriota bacterium]